MKFGFLKDKIEFECEGFSVKILEGFDEKMDIFRSSYPVSGGFIYAPQKQLHHLPKEKKQFSSPEPMVSGQLLFLPPTHEICSTYDDEHNAFLILGYGFLQGLYLCPEGQGAFGRTPYEPSSINGLLLYRSDREKGMEVINQYFINANVEQRSQMRACIHWFLIAYSMDHEWERFDAYYKVLDGLFRLNFKLNPNNSKSILHPERPVELASLYGIQIPSWAVIEDKKSVLSVQRNELAHEATFAKQPIGFALPQENYSFELCAFLTKLIAATLGLKTDYLYSEPDMREKWRWEIE
ncbi:hypothetical protein DN730_03955 [Marinomonas piezotolerans]|uniref:Apea-like HEPN domain-containing protein n=1 Tax=Marinomonas piezotolerans TaxID=2213058 RepID=A0A370UEI9_9GAMM|nr:hypothetical protein [Marinomonas piezotolerans]RDL46200.1 hypothetical protein DN730_03955 [Marinomonas piezotolerans]